MEGVGSDDRRRVTDVTLLIQSPIRGSDMKMRMNQNGSAAFSANQYSAHQYSTGQDAPSSLSALLSDAGKVVNLWRGRRRERRAIRHLDDHMLRDIGLDRVTAESVGTRPFWKA
jgi:uncharacterized protein YjiS (DUF1127 family)